MKKFITATNVPTGVLAIKPDKGKAIFMDGVKTPALVMSTIFTFISWAVMPLVADTM